MPDTLTITGAQASSRPLHEPLLALWRKEREAWARYDAASDRAEEEKSPGNERASEEALEAYKLAQEAFARMEPTTALGEFVKLLACDDGYDFADNHPDIVETIIEHLQSRMGASA